MDRLPFTVHGLSSIVYPMPFTGFLWFVLTLLPLVILQRLLHREIQAVFLILTRNPQLTIGLFSVMLLPGVFLHEASHFLMAKLLRVPTGKASLIPRSLPNGRLLMGYVETAQTDIVRDSLIGIAPLVTGSLFIAYAGMDRLGLGALLGVLANGQFELFWRGLILLPQVNDFFLWFYLAFAVSSTMLPSESDRHSWLPLSLWTAGLLALGIFAGAGVWMLENIAPLMNEFLGTVATLFGLSVILHFVLLPPTMLLHRIVARVTGVDVR
jgi:hypothetical protein